MPQRGKTLNKLSINNLSQGMCRRSALANTPIKITVAISLKVQYGQKKKKKIKDDLFWDAAQTKYVENLFSRFSGRWRYSLTCMSVYFHRSHQYLLKGRPWVPESPMWTGTAMIRLLGCGGRSQHSLIAHDIKQLSRAVAHLYPIHTTWNEEKKMANYFTIYSKVPILWQPLGLSKSGLKDPFWTVRKVVSNQMYIGCRK